MRVNKNECHLTKILYVFDLDVNLLFERRFIKCELIKNFNNDDLYMHIKKSIEMFKTFARENIYIINKITFELKKFTLSIKNDFVSIVFVFSIALSTISNLKKFFSKHEHVDLNSKSQQFQFKS